MTPLERDIRARIARDGPLPLAAYMRLALGHREHGYYATREAIGRGGDFVTAPEISQTFGELVGLWCAVTWEAMGRPVSVRLVELGPGRGTLMADALRAAAVVPAFRAALEVHLVETSPRLAAVQQRTLGAAAATWHTCLDAVPEGPALHVANELFDALPVEQYVRYGDGWRRRAVTVDAATGALAFADVAGDAPDLPDDPPGTVREACPDGVALAARLARRIAAHGGAALIVDYGPLHPAPGASLQAVRDHRFHDVLTDPGTADLSAHVDFAALAEAARGAGARAWGPVTQRSFLRRLGIELRLARLAKAGAAGAAESVARLIDPAGMGTLFKVLAIAHPALPAPQGFEPTEERRPPC